MIKDEAKEQGVYVATIPYTELTEDGRMKRQLNGFQICIEFLKDYSDLGKTINAALKRRRNYILLNRFLDNHPEVDMVNGKNVDKYVAYMNTLDFGMVVDYVLRHGG